MKQFDSERLTMKIGIILLVLTGFVYLAVSAHFVLPLFAGLPMSESWLVSIIIGWVIFMVWLAVTALIVYVVGGMLSVLSLLLGGIVSALFSLFSRLYHS